MNFGGLGNWFKKRIDELSGSNPAAQRSIQDANRRIAQTPARFGVLANPAARQQFVQQQAPRQNFQQLGPKPSYGNGLSAYWNSARDVFDANSQMDYFKRNQAAMQNWRAPMLPPELNQSYREQQIAMGNKRPYQNLGAAVMGSTARFLNTGDAAAREARDTALMLAAQAAKKNDAYKAISDSNEKFKQEAYQPDSGLLGQGTIFDKPEDFNTMGAKEITKRIAANTAGTALEIAPFSKGAGLGANIMSKAPNAAARAGLRFGAGAAEGAAQDVLEQKFTRDKWNPQQTIISAGLSGLLGAGAPAVGDALTTAAGKGKGVVSNRIPLNQDGFISIRNPEGADFGGFKINNPDNARMGLPINNPDGAVVRRPLKISNPLGADTGRSLKVNNKTGAPLVGEGLSGAAQQSFLSKGAREPLDRIDGLNDMMFAKSPFSTADDINRMSPAMKKFSQLVDDAKKKLTPLDEGGFIRLGKQADEPKPKGFMIADTKPRNGRVDTVRISVGKNGKLQRTIQSELSPKELEMGRALGLSDDQLMQAKRGVDNAGDSLPFKEAPGKQPLPGPEDVIGPKQPVQAPVVKDLSDKTVKNDFMDTTNRFLGGRKATTTRNTGVARQLPKLDENQSVSLMDAIEEGSSTGNFGNIPASVRGILDAKHQELRGAGVNIGYLENYFPHKWQNEDAVRQKFQTLNLKAGIQNAREFPTIAEGVKLGFTPATTDYRKAIKAYLDTADRLLENRKYFDELKSKGLIAEAGSRPQGMQVVDAPGLPQPRPFTDPETGAQIQGAYYAKPDVAKNLNRLFGDNSPHGIFESSLDKTAGAASLVQDVRLSGGIPFTPVNAFTIAQGTKDVLSGNLKSPIVATINSFSKKGFNKYIDANRPIVEALERQGFPLRTDYNLSQFADEVVNASGLKGKAKALARETWDKAFNDPTFRRFMPSLQIEMFKKVYNKQIKKNVSQEVAEKTAAKAVQNFYGINTAAKDAFRNQTANNVATTFLFAPKYRESMINFWVNNVKALSPNNITKPEYRANLKFIVGAGMSYAALDYLNKQQTGGHLWDNPDDKKDKALVTGGPGGKDVGIPFLSSIATIPRYGVSMGVNSVKALTGDDDARKNAIKTAAGFLGAGVRPLYDAFVTNENYFGDKIAEDGAPAGEALKQRLGYLASEYQHPYLREGIRAAQGKNKSWQETASKATELPLRWYDPKYYTYNGEFNPRGKEGSMFTIAEQRDRAGQKAEIRNIADNLGLNKRQRADFESLTAVEFNDDGTLKEDNNPFYKSQRYTKLQDDGVFEAMRQKALKNSKLNGQPIDPIYTLQGQMRRAILWKKTLPPGTSDPTVKQLYAQDWYQDYRKAEGDYYKAKQAWSKQMGYKSTPSNSTPYPQASKQVDKAMDYYFKLPKGTGDRSSFIRNNPKVWDQMVAYWQAQDDWTNGERGKLGLGPVEEYESTGSNYSGSGGRRSYARIGHRGGRRGGGARGANLPNIKIGGDVAPKPIKLTSINAPAAYAKVRKPAARKAKKVAIKISGEKLKKA